MGGDGSICLFSNGKLTILTKDKVHLTSCMIADSSGTLFTGSLNNTINGYKLKTNDHTLSAPLLFSYRASTLGNQDFIQCITVDRKRSRLLYGTSQNGIIFMKPENGKWIPSGQINIASGLSNNNVVTLKWHNDSTLLAGTGYGLDKINFTGSGDSFYVHNINDYYNFSNTVYSIIKDESGHILLGTEAGLMEIPTVDIEQYLATDLPVAIAAIQIPGIPDSTINAKKPVELPYNNSGITITYSSPSFVMKNSTRFTYLLEGGNQSNWSTPSASNHVTFLNLAPGRYRFIVKPVNIYGKISNSGASVALIIEPAFWQRWWFNLAILIALASLIYFLVRRRISHIRRESALKNKIAETEMMALRAQMNPHFIFNCMNIIDGLITSDRKQEAQDFLQKFSQLIRLVLENSQYQQVPLQQDLQALKLYTELESIRSNHHFKYKFDVEEELLQDNYKIPPLLLQPYIENAIVHGLRNKENGEGRLFVQIKKDHDEIVALVEDNGIGRERSMQLNEENKKPHQSLGMKVTAKRIDLLRMVNQNKISVCITDLQSGHDTGTVVRIILPPDLRFE
jgi:two-component sensor histidine kinase